MSALFHAFRPCKPAWPSHAHSIGDHSSCNNDKKRARNVPRQVEIEGILQGCVLRRLFSVFAVGFDKLAGCLREEILVTIHIDTNNCVGLLLPAALPSSQVVVGADQGVACVVRAGGGHCRCNLRRKRGRWNL